MASIPSLSSGAAGVTGGPPSEAGFVRVLRDHALRSVNVTEDDRGNARGNIIGLSLNEIQDHADLSRPSVAGLIKRFGPVLETQDAYGNPPEPDDLARRWMINAGAGCSFAIEVGREVTRVARFDLFGRLAGHRLIEIEGPETADEVLGEAVKALRDLLHDEPTTNVLGIGVSVAAPIAAGRSIRASVPVPADATDMEHRWEDWQLMSVTEQLRARLPWGEVPIVLENNANANVLAECTWGVARSSPLRETVLTNVIYLEWSRGIGAGLFLDGALYTGEGKAGEIGHTIIHDDDHTDEADAPCEWCGSKGCLEALAGWGAIVNAARPGRARRYATSDDFADAVVRARSEPESHAGVAFRSAAHEVARVLGPLIHVLNPQVVVIGGDVGREAYDIVSLTLRSHLKMYAMRPALADVTVVDSRFDHSTAALRGAAALLVRPELAQRSQSARSQRFKADPLLSLLRRLADQAPISPFLAS